MYKAFIIEDEFPARQRVKKLLSEYSTDINLIGETDNGKNAIEQIALLRPDVLFLDIQLPDMTCLLYTSPSPRDATLSRMPSSA